MSADTEALLATVREARDALERLYINVRVEYPFGVRDWEIVKDHLTSLAVELERVKAEVKMLTSRNQFLSTEQIRADVNAALLDKALSALREIEGHHHQTGTAWVRSYNIVRDIARAAIAEIEGEGR